MEHPLAATHDGTKWITFAEEKLAWKESHTEEGTQSAQSVLSVMVMVHHHYDIFLHRG